MSIQAMTWAWSQVVGSATRKLLLQCLANYADEYGVCWPSQRRISADTELGESATRYALKRLEADGFLKRKTRTRPNGSRTSDLFELQLHNNTKEPKKSGPSNSEGGAVKPRRASPQIMKGNEPSSEPSKGSSSFPSSKSDGRREGFNRLWKGWPEKERPDSRDAAEITFRKLSDDDQHAAVAYAEHFRAQAKALSKRALMIPYLKQHSFDDFKSGLKFTDDGYFKIEPNSKEWPSWLQHIEITISKAARSRVEVEGFLLTRTRLPPAIETPRQLC